ncbi:MAG: pitrilysin family protein [Gemmatimonadota bacterium]|nr:pitrilysin family protein [Gemmatimonadota bacterium]
MSAGRTPPAAGLIRPYAFPSIERRRLSNGMDVRLVSQDTGPVVTGMVVLRAGETAVPASDSGLAVLTGDALEGGTSRLSSTELARALEDVGASFGAATGWDSTTVAVSCQAEHLARAMPLLAQMVRRPAFEEAEFERYRQQRLATTVQRRMNPSALAVDAHARFVFADGATYGRPLGGVETSLSHLGAEDARGFAGGRYGPAEAAAVIVGSLDPAEAMAVAEEGLGDWHRDVAALPEPNARPRSRKRAVHVVNRPGSVQSQIRVGHVGVDRGVDDYFATIVLNLILGGSFSSRLNLNLRERRGFTYGVTSSFAPRRGPGPFAVSTAVENAVTGAAVAEIFREIEGIVAAGPNRDEVDTARNYLAGVFPLRLETTGQVASRVAGMIVYGLDDDYYRMYRDRVASVTRADVAAAARRHLRPGELCTVVVGDAGEVAAQLKALDIGPVHVHDEIGPEAGQ